MSKVLILVEGQTEETFVRDVLAPHLSTVGIFLKSTLAITKHVEGGPNFKGGSVSYKKLRKDILRLLGDSSAELVTTMFDFYRLPKSFPGRAKMPAGSCQAKVNYLEEQLRQDIKHRRFLPYLALHEFEALLFVLPEKTAQSLNNPQMGEKLQQIKASFPSPEEIDEQEPPSKRILDLFPEYQKRIDGPLAVLEAGLDLIRTECPHFNHWLKRLENLSP